MELEGLKKRDSFMNLVILGVSSNGRGPHSHKVNNAGSNPATPTTDLLNFHPTHHRVFMRALILNADYSYLSTAPDWVHGLRLLLRGRVTPLEFYDRKVKSENEEHALPAVAILKSYANIGRRRQVFSLPSHKNILIRENFTCAYCGCKITLRSITKDHVIPRSKGGKDDLLNVVAACKACNGKKSDKTPSEAGMRLLKHPRHLTDEEKLSVVMKYHDSSERSVWLGWLKKNGVNLF